MPNNRQWAALFWVVAFVAWALSRGDVRTSMGALVRTLASPKILAPLVAMAGWVAGLVYLASKWSLWDPTLATDTAFWFATAGLVLFGKFTDVGKEPLFLRRKAQSVLGLAAGIEVYSEFFVLNLVAELVLQPALAAVACLAVVAAQRKEHHQVKKLANGIMTIAGLGLLLYVSVSVVNNWAALEKEGLIREFALPVWLTIGLLPFVYFTGLFAAYELAFMRIDWRSDENRWARIRAKLVLLVSFHVRAREVGAFSGPWQFRLAQARSFRDARRVVREFRHAESSGQVNSVW